MELSTRCEEACQVLERTNDGNTLAPEELSLLEGAVNDNLNERGEKAWKKLHSTVMEGTFVPFKDRPFRDVENITADPNGAGGGLWILYKGKQIDHYDMPWAYSDKAMEELLELKRRCEIIEGRGEEASTTTVIWDWED